MVESNRHKEGWLIFTFYVFHLFSQKIKLFNCFFNKYTDLCQRRLSGLFPHNWLPHEIHLFNPLNSQSHFPGTWQHQIKLAGHNHSLFLLYVINFKLADALKKKIHLKSSVESERLNIIIKNANPILTYLRLWFEKRDITTFECMVFYWEHFSRVKVQSNRSANSKACIYRNTFCTRKIG